jgi:hypothetical protein
LSSFYAKVNIIFFLPKNIRKNMFFDYKPKRVVRPPTAYATAGLAVINSDKSDAGTPKGRCCCAEWAVLQSETARFVVQDSPFQTAIRPALQPSVSQAVEENHRDGGNVLQ